MPEELTDEQLENHFADLYVDGLGWIIPPGAAAVRATVRRRRAVSTIAAVTTALALATGVGLTSGVWGNRPSDTTAGAGRKLTRAELNVYSALAESSIDLASRGRESVMVMREPLQPDSTFESLRLTRGLSSDSRLAPSGPHQAFVSCVGTGTIRVTITLGSVDETTGDFSKGPLAYAKIERVTCANPSSPDLGGRLDELATHVREYALPAAPENSTLRVSIDDLDKDAMNGASFAVGFPDGNEVTK